MMPDTRIVWCCL